MNKTKIAIIGASGYSGQELVRLLLRHPRVQITQFTSRQSAGKPVGDVFPRFRGQVDAVFIEPNIAEIHADVAFLALPHGVAAEFAVPLLKKGIKVLDLSADFRLKSAATYKEYYAHDHPAPDLLVQAVYGSPEIRRAEIRKAQLVACPGCYPTSILLGLMPALKKGLIKPNSIIASSMSGVSGAGRKAAEDYLFCECNESARAYGVPKHRHLSEIDQEISLLAGQPVAINFIPHLIPLNRGIESTIIADLAGKADNALALYREFYKSEPFVRVTDEMPDTKNVESTNFCDISVRVDARTNRLIVSSVIDNLTKGAAGQAVQCMNLVCGYEETLGLLKIDGSVTAPRGFRAAGMHVGIKKTGKKDLALIVSDVPATVAAVFTRNQVKAAPVKLDMQHVKGGQARAIVANSGNANACTGAVGAVHAKAMATAVARRLGAPTEHVLVCSTGRIGVLLPIVKVEAGIKKILKHVSRDGAHDAATAIMTSDTFAKEYAVSFKAGGKTFHVGGIAKGAGMIHPNMATMLGFITTDVAISRAALQRAIRHAANQSFNRVSVDGDMSTNDTVICLANGMAGKAPLPAFQAALDHVCLELAKMMVRDGEGVSKFVTVEIHGARNDRDAEFAARAVSNSMLVKCSWCGGDPNWGRLMDAIGYSRARVVEEKVDIAYDGLPAVRHGQPTRTPVAKLRKIVKGPTFTIRIDLHLGHGHCTMHTCDLTENYVTFNKGE